MSAGIPYSITIYGNNSFLGRQGYFGFGTFAFSICSQTHHAGWADPIVQQYVSCTEDGYSLQTCTRCGEIRTVDITPATGHKFGDWMVELEATCGMEGSEYRRCETCQQRVENRVIDFALPHTPGDEWTVVQEPDCILAGYQSHLCVVCGKETDYFELPATGHEKLTDPTTTLSPSCLNDGRFIYRCAKCNELLEEINSPALGHNWGEWEIIYEAYPENDGARRHKCLRCGESEEEWFEFIPDSATPFWRCPQCATEKNFGNYCYRCGLEKPVTTICLYCGEDLGEGYDKPRCYMCGELVFFE